MLQLKSNSAFLKQLSTAVFFFILRTVRSIFPTISDKKRLEIKHLACCLGPLKTASTRPEDMSEHRQNNDIYNRNVGPE